YQEEVRQLANEPLELFPASAPKQVTSAAEERSTLLDKQKASADATARVTGAPDASSYETSGADYRAVTSKRELEELVATLRKQSLISVDTETTGLGKEARLCGISFSWRAGQGVYVPTLSPNPSAHCSGAEVAAALRPVLESEQIAKCGHNLKFDALALLN